MDVLIVRGWWTLMQRAWPYWASGLGVLLVLTTLHVIRRAPSPDRVEVVAIRRLLEPPPGAEITGSIEFLSDTRLMLGFAFRTDATCSDVVTFYRKVALARAFLAEASGKGIFDGERHVWRKGRICLVADCAPHGDHGTRRRSVVYVARPWFGSGVCDASR